MRGVIRPQVGNAKRDTLIIAFYDTGEYAPKQIARMMRERGYQLVTVRVVRYVVNREKLHAEHFGNFPSPQTVEPNRDHA